ncbi:Structure-specific endonuclease subunit SLX1 [Mycena venus]|uniref:Structure-specific endonuclease subunit SLX1 n=1 Tax=Mycena venus TaxID=2733690 RepID=A0A8H6YNU1_9AGAR|nr:Structure-specific endonuclease subunit SLX1 [Mycena venus]
MLLSLMTDQFALSPIRSHEIPAVMQLHSALLPISYPRSFFLHLLIQPTRLCLVARNDGDPVAFISAAMHPGQRIEILTLGVLPPFQQHRLATRLVHAVIDALASTAAVVTVFAQVSVSNASAKEFYRHMGMLPSGGVIHDITTTLGMVPRQPTARSSLLFHSFPPFYACYLLKSIQTPTSTATYIGSTPNPPRRIRQHNGELTQGAYKTRLRRPWVMQMIVYGFPSKLAALQFEWAWQHAHISRHLRDADGKAILRRANTVSTNIRTVRLMLSTHPWNTWPLHVKLFTDAAVKGWKSANDSVDGKSGQAGSGRRGPLSVDDAQFTSAHLAKNTALLASNRRLTCSICNKDILNYSTDPLKTTLCPTTGCTTVSHLSCLSENFLLSQTSDTGMIPRGGHCRSCRTYVLWGDIIRGMYRRSAGGAILEEEEGDDDALFLSDIESDAALLPKTSKAKGKAKAASPNRRGPLQEDESSEGEAFDFDVGSSSESESLSPRKPGRPRKNSTVVVDAPKPSPRKPGSSKRGRPKLVQQEGESSSGEAFDFNVSSSTESDPPSLRKRGRPRSIIVDAPGPSPRKRVKSRDALDVDIPDAPAPKKLAAKSTAAAPSLATKSPPKRQGAKKSSPKKYHTVAEVNPVDSSDFFDSDSLSFSDLGGKIAPQDYLPQRPSNLGPARKKLVLKPGEVDFFDNTQEDAISRAMSVLSVASREDVIILSD